MISAMQWWKTREKKNIPPKSNIETQNDGFLDVSPFKHGYFGYIMLDFRGVDFSAVSPIRWNPGRLWKMESYRSGMKLN